MEACIIIMGENGVGGRELRSSSMLRFELIDRRYELCERRASGL
jgi:hypothetical protein